MNKNDALVLIFSRNAFYKRLHYLALGALALSLIAILALFTIFIYLYRNPTHPLYFATDNVSRLIEIVPVNVPNMKPEDVVAWSVEAVESAYSYDYINYRGQLQSVEKYFTTYGWNKYMSALASSNNLVALTQRKMIQLAHVVEPPKILAQGILGGSFAWKFQLPVLVTYSTPPYDDKSQFSNALLVTVIVQRQPVLQGYKGLGIVQMYAESPKGAGTNQPEEISGTPT